MGGFGSLMKQHRWLVILTVCVSILSIAIAFAWNLNIADVIDAICDKKVLSVRKIGFMCLLAFAVAVIEGGFTLISGYTAEKMSLSLRESFATWIQSKKSTELAKMNVGVQISKLLNEVNEISEYLTENLFMLINNVVKCIFTFIWLFSINWKLTLATNLPILLIVFYTTFSSKVLGNLALESQKARQNTNGIADTILTMFPVMKLYNAEKVMLKSYTDATNRWVEVGSKEEKGRSFLMSLSAILACIPTLCLILFGGTMMLRGEISVGVLYLFLNMSANITGVLMNLPGTIGMFRRFSSNFKSMSV